jgi:hypothetical protein
MILYANQNHPNLKTEYPIWADRIKQIAKIWKNLPNDKRQPYVQAARENRTASRMNKQVRFFFFTFKNAIYCFMKKTIFCINKDLLSS